MVVDVFEPAMGELKVNRQRVFGPKSFQDYLTENKLPKKQTAPLISIDAYEKLPLSLRSNGVMVLRLGSSPTGSGTQFVLIKPDGHLNDFFLFDQEVFKEEGSTFLPTASMRDLFVYQLLPTFTETSFINLAIASGLLGHALELSQHKPIIIPATGQSAYTFDVRLHSSISTVYQHKKGQVEIDALFLGQRDGKDVLFVLEAKSGPQKSLSKHKLVYPIMAIAERVPLDIQIVPVYMKTAILKDGLHYNILECSFPDVRHIPAAIDQLKPVKHTYLILRGLVSGVGW